MPIQLCNYCQLDSTTINLAIKFDSIIYNNLKINNPVKSQPLSYAHLTIPNQIKLQSTLLLNLSDSLV